jgi:hypothetical protein
LKKKWAKDDARKAREAAAAAKGEEGEGGDGKRRKLDDGSAVAVDAVDSVEVSEVWTLDNRGDSVLTPWVACRLYVDRTSQANSASLQVHLSRGPLCHWTSRDPIR